jgi:hypothetical protein
MRRFAGLWVSALVLVGVTAGAAPGATAYARPAAAPANVSAGYRLHQNLGGQGYLRSLMTLLENHTGYTDLDTIVWSRDDRRITLVLTSRQNPSDQVTYVGTLTHGQISSRRHPGTISGSNGETGIFYAVKTG